jgi:Flp pilus assembly protein TadG
MSECSNVFGRCVARRARQLRRDRRGATLVEFSLIAFPLLILLFGTFEVGFIYWANQELDNATRDAARLVRTGEAQARNLNQAQLKTEVCSRTAILVGCASRLRLDVRSAPSFDAITPPEPSNGSGGLKDDGEFSYAPGVGNDVVLVSAFFDWRLLLSGTTIIRAATPARNEPF